MDKEKKYWVNYYSGSKKRIEYLKFNSFLDRSRYYFSNKNITKSLKLLKKKTTYNEVLKSIKKRDKSDLNRKFSPLKKTKDSILINTTNLTKRSCFLKIKKIMDKKLKLNGNL